MSTMRDRRLSREHLLWYEKIRRSGFVDIETGDRGRDGWLKTDKRIDIGKALEYEAQAEYYRLAGQHEHEGTFDSDFERKVWALHASGLSVRDIVEEVQSSIHLVHDAIAKARKAMFLALSSEADGEGTAGSPGSDTGDTRAGGMGERGPREILRDVLTLIDSDVQAMRLRLEQREPDKRTLSHEEIKSLAETAKLLMQAERDEAALLDRDLRTLNAKELGVLRDLARGVRERRPNDKR